MCGLTGYIDTTNEIDKTIISKMVKTLEHRGPDSYGVYQNESNSYFSAFGHTRLSIIDLSKLGNQPMHYKTFTIVFNGEIYNYMEIKHTLIKLGHQFVSDSDTEVILHSFEEWGKNCVQKFIGMFAFVIYDKESNLVHFCRDRAGVKPLYYYWDKEVLIFGSELKSLIAHPRFIKKIDKKALKSYFQFGYVPSPLAIFGNTKKIDPGKWLTFNVFDKSFVESTYWSVVNCYEQEKFKGSYWDALNTTDDLLQSAIDYRMVSDVPVGVFLSGGFDSSLVTAKLQKNRTEKIKTFTIGFEEGNNEAPHAKRVANHLGTDHHEMVCSTNEAKDLVETIPYHYDEPFSDSSAIPTMLVSKFAKEHVTVALSADAGDELFAGYSRYQVFLNHIKSFNKVPESLHKIVGSVGLLGTKTGLFGNGEIRKKAESISYSFLEKSKNEKILSVFKYMNSAPQFYIDQLLVDSDIISLKEGYNLNGDYKSNLDIALSNDYFMYLQNDILTKVDRASMAFSLEGREPLLDHRLIEFAATLPDNFKLSQNGGKRILKDLAYKYLPKEIMDRPKAGFSIPYENWLRNDLSYLLDEFLDDDSIDKALFNERFIHSMLASFKKGEFYFSTYVWRLLMFQMWYKQWMR